MTSLDALVGPDRRAQLEALRDLLAEALTTTGARDLPALTSRYLTVVDHLDALLKEEEEPSAAARFASTRQPRTRRR